MRRGLAAITAAFSCLVLALVLGLWVRSYRACDVLLRQRGPHDRLAITSEFGVLVFEFEPRQVAAVETGWVYFDNPLPRRWRSREGVLGISAYRTTARHYLLLPPTRVYAVTLPHAVPAALASILPAAWAAKRVRLKVRRQRADRGLCPHCGYDLRASPERCPECGATAP